MNKKIYKKKRKEAKSEYSAQVRNFANDLPERLRTDYLLFAGELQHKCQMNNTPLSNGHDDTQNSQPIRQRRKSLTALPDSLQTAITTDNIQTKLTRSQLHQLHKCMPRVIYYENDVSDSEKPTFTRMMTKKCLYANII